MRSLPRLYAILDAEAVRGAGVELLETAQALRRAGVLLLQYRDKQAAETEILDNARRIAKVFAGSGALLILNDSPQLARAAGWDGVHVGQTDAAVAEARAIVGRGRLVGVSTHTAAQMQAAEATDADYLAAGPIFRTDSKADAAAAIGLAGLRTMRLLCRRPLVAIGGIGSGSAQETMAAGADSVAVIGALFEPGRSVEENARRLLAVVSGALE